MTPIPPALHGPSAEARALTTRDFNTAALSLSIRSTGGDATKAEFIVEGLAVPYDTETTLADGYFEVIARGAVEEPEAAPVLLFWRHGEPIGVVIASSNEDDGYHIRARISDTPRGREAYQLLKDGVISRMSIGFEAIEWKEEETERSILTTFTKILVREVSLVPFPAYPTATVTNVREAPTRKETHRMETTDTIDAAEVRAALAELQRDVALIRDTPTTPTLDTRSSGQFLKDLAAGDQATRDAYNAMVERAWDGTKLADDAAAKHPMWTKDLVRIYEAEDYLGRHFQTAPLAATGMSAEFLRLATNTLQVAEQTEEGADLVFGKMSTSSDVAKVKTFGGYTSLSIPEIERGSAAMLTRQLQALSMAAGYASANQFNKDFNTAAKAAPATMTFKKAPASWKWADIAAFLIDAHKAFKAAHLPLTGMIVSPDVFSALAQLTDGQDNPRMPLTGTSTPGTQVGTIDTSELFGSLGSLTIQPYWDMQPGDLGDTVDAALFSSQALVRYQTATTQLQDTNIVNLTRSWSVYRYGMNAAEAPAGILPIKAAAGA